MEMIHFIAHFLLFTGGKCQEEGTLDFSTVR